MNPLSFENFKKAELTFPHSFLTPSVSSYWLNNPRQSLTVHSPPAWHCWSTGTKYSLLCSKHPTNRYNMYIILWLAVLANQKPLFEWDVIPYPMISSFSQSEATIWVRCDPIYLLHGIWEFKMAHISLYQTLACLQLKSYWIFPSNLCSDFLMISKLKYCHWHYKPNRPVVTYRVLFWRFLYSIHDDPWPWPMTRSYFCNLWVQTNHNFIV